VLPDTPVSLSSEVLPELIEYERTITTVRTLIYVQFGHHIHESFTNVGKVANSYVKTSVSLYLNNLKSLQGKTKHLRILQSDGGLSSASLASKFPVSLALSGPAGGDSGVASVVAAQTKYKNRITVDMGVCLIPQKQAI
jgi:5-oxoprolinase (ATP-hydrolysing)